MASGASPITASKGEERHLEALSDVNLDALLLGAVEDLLQHDVGNLLDLALGQLAEHNDLVQPVQELGPAHPQSHNLSGPTPQQQAFPTCHKTCFNTCQVATQVQTSLSKQACVCLLAFPSCQEEAGIYTAKVARHTLTRLCQQ